jgi:hypothetical protein
MLKCPGQCIGDLIILTAYKQKQDLVIKLDAKELTLKNPTAGDLQRFINSINNISLPNLTRIEILDDNAGAYAERATDLKDKIYVLSLNCPQLTTIIIDCKLGVPCIDLTKCPQLQIVKVSDRNAKNVILASSIKSLEMLDYSNSGITFVILSDQPKLSFAKLDHSAIEEVCFLNCTAIKMLDLGHTPTLRNLDLECPKLETLSLEESSLPALDLDACTQVKSLNLKKAKTASLKISKLRHLRNLDLDGTGLQLVPELHKSARLNELDLGDMALSELARLIVKKLAHTTKTVHISGLLPTAMPTQQEFAKIARAHFKPFLDTLIAMQLIPVAQWSDQQEEQVNTLIRECKSQFDNVNYYLHSGNYKQGLKTLATLLNSVIADTSAKFSSQNHSLEYTALERDGKSIDFADISLADLADVETLIFDNVNVIQLVDFFNKIDGEVLMLKVLDLRIFPSEDIDPEELSKVAQLKNINLNCPYLKVLRLDTPCVLSFDVSRCARLSEVDLMGSGLSLVELPTLDQLKAVNPGMKVLLDDMQESSDIKAQILALKGMYV